MMGMYAHASTYTGEIDSSLAVLLSTGERKKIFEAGEIRPTHPTEGRAGEAFSATEKIFFDVTGRERESMLPRKLHGTTDP